jgi:hypothetical protein
MGNPAKLQEFSTFPANQPVKMQGQGRKKRSIQDAPLF